MSGFAYTGTEQTWSVPAGVSWIHVVAIGAPGGGAGGDGAVVSGDVPLPAGQHVLYVEVGGSGGTPGGGFNGGGAGGADQWNSAVASGGGGATDVQTCSSATAAPCSTAGSPLASRLIVAAGGGGAGDNGSGGNAGADGNPNDDRYHEGGYAATQTAGGLIGGAACFGYFTSASLGQGGAGLTGSNDGPFHAGPSGGGGGGGLYGGGGGAGFDELCDTTGGGGGGGSSYIYGDASVPPFTLDSTGKPSITITPLAQPPSDPALSCTFTVNGRYRSQITIDAAYLEDLGVPPADVPAALDDLAAKSQDIPPDWNVHCTLQGEFGPTSTATVGGHPSAAAPYLSCQMNNVTASNDTMFEVNEAFLQSIGIGPSAWDAVLGRLESIAQALPSSWGVSCTLENAA